MSNLLLRNEIWQLFTFANFINLDCIYIFFQNTICGNVQTKTSLKFTEFLLSEFFHSSFNTTPATPAAAPTKKNMEVSGVVDRKVQMAPVSWKRKQNVLRVLQGVSKWKKTQYSPRIKHKFIMYMWKNVKCEQ